ncbi:MAG: AAA family ATPase [Magnetococcales bacterium]|nr:AAA family ATPase [Magnetococcales bacterium]
MLAMISIINYRSIKKLDKLKLGNFHVLTGPNASGKSTLLDAIYFVRDCLIKGPSESVASRVADYSDLTWNRNGKAVAIELWFDFYVDEKPCEPPKKTEANENINRLDIKYKNNCILYSLSLEWKDGKIASKELLTCYPKNIKKPEQFVELSQRTISENDLLGSFENKKWFRREDGSGSTDYFNFQPAYLYLQYIPPDLTLYPTANKIKDLIINNFHLIKLDSGVMRRPYPAHSPISSMLASDGANIASIIWQLNNKVQRDGASGYDGCKRDRWIRLVQLALPEILSVPPMKTEPNNAEYFKVDYHGFACPCWSLSEGTLRILGLTLLPFLSGFESGSPRIIMVEEPENGVHPKGLEIIMIALSSVSFAQVLVTTHSPSVVQYTGRDRLLCISKDPEEGTLIQLGSDHPVLKRWDGYRSHADPCEEEIDLAAIFASGILG